MYYVGVKMVLTLGYWRGVFWISNSYILCRKSAQNGYFLE